MTDRPAWADALIGVLAILVVVAVFSFPIRIKAFEGSIPVPAPVPRPFMPPPIFLAVYDWQIGSLDLSWDWYDGETGDRFTGTFRLEDVRYSYELVVDADNETLRVEIDFDSNLSFLELKVHNLANTTVGKWVEETGLNDDNTTHKTTRWQNTGWVMDDTGFNFTLTGMSARGKLILDLPVDGPSIGSPDHDCVPPGPPGEGGGDRADGYGDDTVKHAHATVVVTVPLWQAILARGSLPGV